MTDYVNMPNEKLDALAAERMGVELVEFEGKLMRNAVNAWSPTTDANDRDEWAAWLRAQGYFFWFWWAPEHCDPGVAHAKFSKDQLDGVVQNRELQANDKSPGRAVVIAGLRATDE